MDSSCKKETTLIYSLGDIVVFQGKNVGYVDVEQFDDGPNNGIIGIRLFYPEDLDDFDDGWDETYVSVNRVELVARRDEYLSNRDQELFLSEILK